MNLEDALLGLDKIPSTLTNEEKKHKDRKDLAQLQLHLSNKILQDVLKEKTASHLYAHRLEKGVSVHEHLTVFKEILLDLQAMEIHYDKEDLSPSGKLVQIEHALIAVGSGQTSLGIK
ncbi:hypothetical protein Goklo_026855, partial [Gossypium klotzschianum]|nr:hypothetical protein [Gossypium klotzschianum]